MSPNHGCQRCGKDTGVTMMSRFNTDTCCMECIEKEKAHPDYKRARDAEEAAVLRGERNFPGIGKPSDL